MVAGGTPATWASARMTRVADAPTRNSPVMIRFSTNVCDTSSSLQQAPIAARCWPASMSFKGITRSAIQRESGRSTGVTSSPRSFRSAIASAKSPTAA